MFGGVLYLGDVFRGAQVVYRGLCMIIVKSLLFISLLFIVKVVVH